VVFRNRLIELIQYEPATPKVHAQPVLIVPSWIMKYYILDLTPGDSLVRYLVDSGHTVFTLSWANPGSEGRDLGMDDYLELGPMAAMKAVQERFPDAGIHAMGYCLGGTLLSIAAAVVGDGRASPFRTVTLLAAQTDFYEPGELGLFIDESQIAFLEDLMAERGYLDGRQMAGAFALINSKDLVWSKLVHEYLMGAQTPVTAIRAWNADATRLPARMHSQVPAQPVPAQRPGGGALQGCRAPDLPGRYHGAAVRRRHGARPCVALDVGVQNAAARERPGELPADVRRAQRGHREPGGRSAGASAGELSIRFARRPQSARGPAGLARCGALVQWIVVALLAAMAQRALLGTSRCRAGGGVDGRRLARAGARDLRAPDVASMCIGARPGPRPAGGRGGRQGWLPKNVVRRASSGCSWMAWQETQ
jgi:hypothetical protein